MGLYDLVKNNPLIFLGSKVWQYSEGNRKNVALYVTLFIFANIIGFAYPLIMAKILNTIQTGGLTAENVYTVIGYAAAFILLEICFWCFHAPARVIEKANAFKVRMNYKKFLLGGIMVLPAEWHADHQSGDTIDKVQKGTDSLYDFSESSHEYIEIIIKFITSYLALIYFNIHSAYIVMIMVILTGLIIRKYDKIIVPQYKILNHAENDISAKIFDVISNITTVIILRIDKQVMKAISKMMSTPYTLDVKNNKVNETKWAMVSLSVSFLTFAVLGSYLYQAYLSNNDVMLGTVFILYGYVERISNIFYQMAWKWGNMIRKKTKILNAEEISNSFKEKRKIEEVKLNGWGSLRIKNLNFSYNLEKGKESHLINVNMDIKRNEHIALIGHSGSGKTTFMKIIRELYTPKTIELYLDNKKVEHGFASISHAISLIPQDPEIFSTTIRENITFGINYSPEELKRFIRMAQFSDVVKRLPKKLESSIFEKGVNLSGGEKQRLALARGLLASQDKQILLMDEPTSSVDTRNEYLIYQNIFKEFNNKTVISSIHRLNLLPLFDKIYMFNEGKIIAHGTFEELLEDSRDFRKLWEAYVKSVQKGKLHA
ncbi:MAG: ABC transporter ATP-binding protein [Candidatus Woesearchaeota archaeon]